MKPGESFEFAPRLSLRCPCGKRVDIGTVEGQGPAGIHELPFCADFERLELLDFLRWVRTHGGQVLQ